MNRDEEYQKRVSQLAKGIDKVVRKAAFHAGVTKEEARKIFLDGLLEQARRREQGPLPDEYDPDQDKSHPIHGWPSSTGD